MAGPIIRNYDKRIYKKCIKCRGWKPREDILGEDADVDIKRGFGKHASSSDGLQSICLLCKNAMNVKARSRNVTQRIRHHTGTRCLTQLGKIAPKNLVANLEEHLGYKIRTLVRHLSTDLKEREGKGRKLRDALQEGYHIDHIKPLSSFPVIRDESADPALVGVELAEKYEGRIAIDWGAFRDCWAISNLSAIPSAENLAKGAQFDDDG